MSGLSADLYSRVRRSLLDSDSFSGNEELTDLFSHPDLLPWRQNVPQRSTASARADAVIDRLVNRSRADTGENALALLLRVLADRTDSGDALHSVLLSLASEVSKSQSSEQAGIRDLGASVREQITRGDVDLGLDRIRNYLASAAPELSQQLKSFAAQDEQAKVVQAVMSVMEQAAAKIPAELAPIAAPPLTSSINVPDRVRLQNILRVNNLKEISWIARGIEVAQSVCRIHTPAGKASGFMIGPSMLMTNHHVIPDGATASKSIAEFNYQADFGGKPSRAVRYPLDKSGFKTSEDLDYTIVQVQDMSGGPSIDSWGTLVLNPHADPVPGEHVVIIQHPNGGFKQIVLTANQVVQLAGSRLYYTTDTMPGSSGSPVFNDQWHVIAIHRAGGGELKVNAHGDARFVNEGVLMSAIKKDAGKYWPA